MNKEDLNPLNNIERLDTIETVESVFQDNQLLITEKEKEIKKMVRKANLTGNIDRIEILEPSKIVKINMERQKIEKK